MAINYFLGWSRQDLEASLRSAQEDLARGKSIIASGSGDIRSQNQITLSIESRIQSLLLALYKIDPDDYPIASVTPITRARVVFSSETASDADSA